MYLCQRGSDATNTNTHTFYVQTLTQNSICFACNFTFILFYFIFVHMLGEYTTQAIYCSSLQLHGLLNSQSSLKLQWSQQDSPASKLTKEWDLINVIYRVRIKLQIHWLKSSLSINHKRQYLTLTWILSLQTLLRMGCMVVWWFSLSPQSLKVVSCSLCVGFLQAFQLPPTV